MTENFLQLRRRLIEKDFGYMNDRQFEAVITTQGALLVLAGAGSGKTTMLVNRIANLVKYGNAYKSDYAPYFTEADISAAQDYLEEKPTNCRRAFFRLTRPARGRSLP